MSSKILRLPWTIRDSNSTYSLYRWLTETDDDIIVKPIIAEPYFMDIIDYKNKKKKLSR